VTRYVVLDIDTVLQSDRVVWVAVAVLHDGTVTEGWSTMSLDINQPALS
jgi:hypothetical protein